jgi:lipopolysaccharide biosynthesis regulator YciM
MRFHVWVTCLLACSAATPAQETAKGLLSAAEKKIESAKGKTGDELAAALKDAALLFEEVSKRFPAAKAETARADLALGRVRRRLGDYGAAEAAWRRAAGSGESRPGAEALHDLATLYRKQKKLPEAEAALDRLVKEFGSEPRERADALVRLGGLHRQQKRPDAAEAALRRVLAEHGDLLTPSLEAVDDLVALKLADDKDAEAAQIFEAQAEALKTRYAGTKQEARLATALDRIQLRLGKAEGPKGGKPAPVEPPHDGAL